MIAPYTVQRKLGFYYTCLIITFCYFNVNCSKTYSEYFLLFFNSKLKVFLFVPLQWYSESRTASGRPENQLNIYYGMIKIYSLVL